MDLKKRLALDDTHKRRLAAAAVAAAAAAVHAMSLAHDYTRFFATASLGAIGNGARAVTWMTPRCLTRFNASTRNGWVRVTVTPDILFHDVAAAATSRNRRIARTCLLDSTDEHTPRTGAQMNARVVAYALLVPKLRQRIMLYTVDEARDVVKKLCACLDRLGYPYDVEDGDVEDQTRVWIFGTGHGHTPVIVVAWGYAW